MSYAEFAEMLSMLIIFFCAVVAPGTRLPGPAQRGAAALLRPAAAAQDYALAQLAALVSATFLLLAGPLTLMFVGAAFSADRLGAVWDESATTWPGSATPPYTRWSSPSLALLVASLPATPGGRGRGDRGRRSC